MLLTIYLLGCIITVFICLYMIKEKGYAEVCDLFLSFIMVCCSWLTVVTILVVTLANSTKILWRSK